MTPENLPFERLGKHLFRVENDTLFLVAHGSLTLEDMRTLLDRYAQIKRSYGCLFIFYDARTATGIDADAREYATKMPNSEQEADLQVAFGISFALRTLINMIIRAQKVLQNRSVKFYAFDKETEARTFFDAECEKIRQSKKR